MSGSNYAGCELCDKKAFYDADTDLQGCLVFHPECLAKLKRNQARLAAALNLVLNDAHVMYGSTATWHGGIGGAAMTMGCAFIDPSPKQEWMHTAAFTQPLRELLNDLDRTFDLPAATEEFKKEMGG